MRWPKTRDFLESERGEAINPAPVSFPKEFDYLSVFLTFRCQYGCEYCQNRQQKEFRPERYEISARQWIEGLNRLELPEGFPVTFEGGEPSLHPGFFEILRQVRHPVNFLSNFEFDVQKLIANVPASALRSPSPAYNPIRITFHPGWSSEARVIGKAHLLQEAGYSLSIYGVSHPDHVENLRGLQIRFADRGIDFRIKPFYGLAHGMAWGSYAYPDAWRNGHRKIRNCRLRSVLFDPQGDLYRCHRELFVGKNSRGNLNHPGFRLRYELEPCWRYGECSPCDVKIATNSAGVGQYTPAEIQRIKP